MPDGGASITDGGLLMPSGGEQCPVRDEQSPVRHDMTPVRYIFADLKTAGNLIKRKGDNYGIFSGIFSRNILN